MNFEELLKYCTKLNESKNDKCLVCHIPLDLDEKHIKLGCSHIFHPDCIKYKTGSFKCLYCEKTSMPTLLNYSNIIYCKMVLKTGPNKNKFCNRPNCQYHKMDTPTNKPINLGCQTVIKTGPKNGQLCGRINCKYH